MPAILFAIRKKQKKEISTEETKIYGIHDIEKKNWKNKNEMLVMTWYG